MLEGSDSVHGANMLGVPWKWDNHGWLPRPRFLQGKIVITIKALAALHRAGQDADFFLEKHTRGDWGEADPRQSAGNESAVLSGRAIVSIHQTLLGEKLLILTNESRTRTTLRTLTE